MKTEIEFLIDLKSEINSGICKSDLKTLINQRLNILRKKDSKKFRGLIIVGSGHELQSRMNAAYIASEIAAKEMPYISHAQIHGTLSEQNSISIRKELGKIGDLLKVNECKDLEFLEEKGSKYHK